MAYYIITSVFFCEYIFNFKIGGKMKIKYVEIKYKDKLLDAFGIKDEETEVLCEIDKSILDLDTIKEAEKSFFEVFNDTIRFWTAISNVIGTYNNLTIQIKEIEINGQKIRKMYRKVVNKEIKDV